MTGRKKKPEEYSQNYHAVYIRKRRKEDPSIREKDYQRIKEIRLNLMDILGGRICVHCGYDQDVRALQIDHITASGNHEERMFKNRHKMYRFYIQNPNIAITKLQVLCANCNAIKLHDNKEWSRN